MNALPLKNTTINTSDTSDTSASVFVKKRDLSQDDYKRYFHRADQRHMTLGLMAVVYDKESKYYCVVDELSEQGLRLVHIPNDFDDATQECKALVFTPSGDIAMHTKPRWTQLTNKGMYKSFGLQVDQPPRNWQNFIQGLKVKADNFSYLLFEDEKGGTN